MKRYFLVLNPHPAVKDAPCSITDNPPKPRETAVPKRERVRLEWESPAKDSVAQDTSSRDITTYLKSEKGI